MDGSFDQRLLQHYSDRDKAAASLKATASNVSDSLKSEIKRLTDGSTIEEIIVKHPFISAGVAIGAGVLVSKFLAGGSSRSSNGEQRVVVEIQHTGPAVAAHSGSAPAASQSFDPLAFVMKAVAGYEAVQNILRNLQTQQEPPVAPEPTETESAPI